MKIINITLNGVILTEEKGLEIVNKYVKDYMTLECLYGGIEIITPEGKLQAIVELE